MPENSNSENERDIKTGRPALEENLAVNILNQADLPMALIDRGYVFVYMNHAFRDLLNLSGNEKDQHLNEVCSHKSYVSFYETEIKRVFKGDRIQFYKDYSLSQKYDEELKPFYDQKGNISAAIWMVRKDTPGIDYKQEELREFLLNTVSNPSVIADDDYTIKASNPSFKDLFSLYTVGEGESFNLKTILNHFNNTNETEYSQLDFWEKKDKWIHINGKPFCLEINPLNGFIGLQNEMLYEFIYCPHQKYGRSDLYNTHQIFHLIEQYSDDLIYMMDVHQHFTYFSHSVEQVLGYSVREALQLQAKDILTDESYHYQWELYQNQIKKGPAGSKTTIIQVELIRKDGMPIIGEAHANIIFDQNGQPTGAFGILRDITERKRIEKALIESKDQLSFVMNNSTDMIYTLDKDQFFTWTSPSVYSMLGYTEEEIKQLHTKDVMTRESYEYQLELYKNDLKKDVLPNELTQIIVVKMVRRDGSEFWGETHVKVLLNDQGEFAGILGVCRDISGRKKLEEELRQSEEKFRSIFDYANDAIFITDLDGNMINANKIACEGLGYTKEEIMNLSSEQWVGNQFRKYLGKLNNGHSLAKQYIFETLIYAKTGDSIPVEINSRGLWFEDEPYIVTIARDITQRKEAEKQEIQNRQNLYWLSESIYYFLKLKKKEDIFRYIGEKLLEMVDDSVIIINSVNEAAQKVTPEYFFGINEQYIQKVLDWMGINPIGKEYDLQDDFVEMYSQQKLISYEGSLHDFAKGLYSNFVLKQISHLLDLKKIYTIGLTRDKKLLSVIHLFKRKKARIENVDLIETFLNQASIAIQRSLLEDELRLSKEKAEESDRLKSAFLANLSHEVRSPLNIILGHTQLLDAGASLTDEQQESVNIINISSNQLLGIIDDIIDISKLETGQQSIQRDLFSLNELIRESYKSFSFKAENQSLAFYYHLGLSDDAGMIYSDRIKLKQVLNNLLNNAFKFTPEGEIEFGYTLSKGFIQFYVKDTGIGISGEHGEKIFDRFMQVENIDSGKFEGTGLGLAISKGLIELMGGRIWYHSAVGQGTVFYFILPYD